MRSLERKPVFHTNLLAHFAFFFTFPLFRINWPAVICFLTTAAQAHWPGLIAQLHKLSLFLVMWAVCATIKYLNTQALSSYKSVFLSRGHPEKRITYFENIANKWLRPFRECAMNSHTLTHTLPWGGGRRQHNFTRDRWFLCLILAKIIAV